MISCRHILFLRSVSSWKVGAWSCPGLPAWEGTRQVVPSQDLMLLLEVLCGMDLALGCPWMKCALPLSGPHS